MASVRRMARTIAMMVPNTHDLIMEVMTSQLDTARVHESRMMLALTSYTVCASRQLHAMPAPQGGAHIMLMEELAAALGTHHCVALTCQCTAHPHVASGKHCSARPCRLPAAAVQLCALPRRITRV